MRVFPSYTLRWSGNPASSPSRGDVGKSLRRSNNPEGLLGDWRYAAMQPSVSGVVREGGAATQWASADLHATAHVACIGKRGKPLHACHRRCGFNPCVGL